MTEGTILAAVFDRETTLGLVRFAVRRALPSLAGSIREGCERSGETRVNLDDGFGSEALTRVDSMFGETS